MNWLVTWLSCPGLEVSGHIIRIHFWHVWLATDMFQHTITNTVWKWTTMRLMHAHAFLQRIIVFFNCDLQTGDDAEKSEGVLNFSIIVLKFWRLPNVNSVNWISSFKLSKFTVVQRYNVAFRFLYVYTVHVYMIIYAHIFIPKSMFWLCLQISWWFL